MLFFLILSLEIWYMFYTYWTYPFGLCLVACSVTQLCPTVCDPMDCSPPGSSVHGDSPGKNTGMGCHFLLQGIFPTQGSNPGLLRLLRWQVDSLPLSRLGSPSFWTSHMSNFQHLLDHRKSKRIPEKHLLLLYWLHQNLWLCGSQETGRFWKRWEYQTTWPASWEICVQVKRQQLEVDMAQ